MARHTTEHPAAHEGKTDDPRQDETFKRHGPEPPENDSGPSQDGDALFRQPGATVRNVDPDQQVD